MRFGSSEKSSENLWSLGALYFLSQSQLKPSLAVGPRLLRASGSSCDLRTDCILPSFSGGKGVSSKIAWLIDNVMRFSKFWWKDLIRKLSLLWKDAGFSPVPDRRASADRVAFAAVFDALVPAADAGAGRRASVSFWNACAVSFWKDVWSSGSFLGYFKRFLKVVFWFNHPGLFLGVIQTSYIRSSRSGHCSAPAWSIIRPCLLHRQRSSGCRTHWCGRFLVGLRGPNVLDGPFITLAW